MKIYWNIIGDYISNEPHLKVFFPCLLYLSSRCNIVACGSELVEVFRKIFSDQEVICRIF